MPRDSNDTKNVLLQLELPALVSFEDEALVGDRIALRLRVGPTSDHRDLTFKELRAQVQASASALLASGCKPGDRIALLMPHSERLITLFFGALYAGFVPAILAWPTAKMDAEKYRRNVTGVVEGLSADWLVTDADTSAKLGAAIGRARVIDPEATHASPTTVAAAPAPRREGTAFIQFSGGTTGTQKSVAISYERLRHQFKAYGQVLALEETDAIATWLPLYHDMGLVACLLMPFFLRLPSTVFAPMEWVMDPAPFLRAMGEHRITHCWLPNFAHSFMASRPLRGATPDLSTLRAVINCSEPVRSHSVDAFVDRFKACGLRPEALHTCYAMAETTFAVSQSTALDPPRRVKVSASALARGQVVSSPEGDRELISCGRPIPGMEVRVMDSEGRAVPDGTVGELRLRGTSLMDDYLDAQRDPALQGRAFRDGWYCTGDMGAVLDGHVYVTGRCKDIIIIGGVNVFPEDVEAAVSRVSGIHPGRCVALGIVDEALGTERLVVVAEADSDELVAQAVSLEAEVRAASLVAAGVAPHRVFIVPPKWIVKSTAGKPSRSETRARLLARQGGLMGDASSTLPSKTEKQT